MKPNSKPIGHPRGGISAFCRAAIAKHPGMSTPELRKLAKRKFGYHYVIDRHFPQLIYRLRRQSTAAGSGNANGNATNN